jgi:VIT1/CCC1 family predicted Fe2+/Mn2+ transporter
LLASLVAIGLALTMVGAILTHLRRKEFGNIILNVILMFAAVLVAITHFSVEAA